MFVIAACTAFAMLAVSIAMWLMMEDGRKRDACIDVALSARVSADPCFPADFIEAQRRNEQEAKRMLGID